MMSMMNQLNQRANSASFPSPRRGLALLLLAIIAMPASLRADPVDDYNAALVFYKQQRWDKAADDFGKFVKNHPTHERAPAARLYVADSNIRLKQFKQARESFRDFVATDKAHPDLYIAMYRIGECSYFLGEYESATKELTAFVTKFPKHELVEWALQYRGEAELQLKEPEAAIRTFQQVIDINPKGQLASEARYMQARAEQSLGNIDSAVKVYRDIIAAKGDRAADAQLEIGMLFFDSRKFTEALKEFDATISTHPATKQAQLAALNAGYAAFHLGQYQDAAARFNTVINDATHGNDARFWLGLSHKALENYDLAIESLKPLAEQQANRELAIKGRFHWGHSERLRGDYAKALTLFREVAEADLQGPLGADALHLATESALLANNLDEADRLDALFTKTFPQHGLTLLQQLIHGRALLARGDELSEQADQETAANALFEEAARVFGEVMTASKVKATERAARLYLARAQDRQQKPEEVILTLKPLVDEFNKTDGPVPPEIADALLVQSNTLLKLGRDEEADAVAKLYVDKAPSGPLLVDALSNMIVTAARRNDATGMKAPLDRLWQMEGARDRAIDATYQAAEASYDSEHWGSAAGLFGRIVEADAKENRFHAAALSGLAYAQNKEGKFLEAAETFARLITEHPEDLALTSSSAYMKGVSLQQADKPTEAIAAFDEAIKQFGIADDNMAPTPEDKAAAANAFLAARGLARVYRSQGNIEAANTAFKSAYTQLDRQQPSTPDPAIDASAATDVAAHQQELAKLLTEWAVFNYEAELFDYSSELFLN